MTRRRSLASTLISLGIVLFVALFVFLKNRIENKGEKCYLDTVVQKEKYNLEFERWYDTYNSRAVVYCSLYITNNTTTDLEVKISDIGVFDDSGTKHKCDKVTLNIKPNDYEEYYFGYYCDHNNDTSKYKLHIKLNGDKYNIYFKNAPTE